MRMIGIEKERTPEEIEHIYNSWGGKEKYACKILLLNKNHKEIRE
jgi:hypothetical protein